MDEGRAMLAAQPEVLFTYRSPMRDYDKIRRPSLQHGVGLLIRFSPRDDPVQLPRTLHKTTVLRLIHMSSDWSVWQHANAQRKM